MIDFELIENALFAWVKSATGFVDAQIIFDSQDGVSPPSALPFATIRIGDLVNVGIDGHRWDFDVGRPLAAEIRRETVGMRELTASIQVFTPTVVGNATARTLAARIQASLGLASIREPLNAAGLGILEKGNVRWIPALDNVNFEGRALLETRFCIPQGAEEFTGYIAKVVVEPTINGTVLPVVEAQLEGVAPYDDFYHHDIP